MVQAEDDNGDKQSGSVIFVCIGKKLMVAVTTEPVDVNDARNLWYKPRYRQTRADLIVGEDNFKKERFLYSPKTKVLFQRDRKNTLKIYNAAILGLPVTIETNKSQTPLQLALPKPNHECVKFGADCGTNAKR